MGQKYVFRVNEVVHAEIGRAGHRRIVLDAVGPRAYGGPALVWDSHVNNFYKLRGIVARKSV